MTHIGMRIAAATALLSVFSGAQSVAAHVPNIASYHLSPGEDAWRLEVNMSTDGMHQALETERPGTDLSALTPQAYENLLVSHLREGIHLRVDDVALSLDHAIVEIRSHASRVVFVMPPPGTSAHRIDAHINALSARGDQNNVFRFLPVPRSRVVLKADNDFRGALELGASTAVPAESAQSPEPTATLETRPKSRRVWLTIGLLFVGLILAGSGVSRSRDRLVP